MASRPTEQTSKTNFPISAYTTGRRAAQIPPPGSRYLPATSTKCDQTDRLIEKCFNFYATRSDSEFSKKGTGQFAFHHFAASPAKEDLHGNMHDLCICSRGNQAIR